LAALDRCAGRAGGAAADVPGDGAVGAGELGGGAGPLAAAADPAGHLRRGSDADRAEGLHGALRGPRLQRAVRAVRPGGRGPRRRRGRAGAAPGPGGRGASAGHAGADRDQSVALRGTGGQSRVRAGAVGSARPALAGDRPAAGGTATVGPVCRLGGGGPMSTTPATKPAAPPLEIDATRDKLARLGLEYAAAALAEELAEAVKHNRPAHGVLERLLTHELAARDERRIKTSLKLACLPPGMTLGNFDFGFQPSLERRQIETLATGAFIREHMTLLVQGPPGVGKTHLCVSLAVKAIEQGFSEAFYRLVDP